MCCPESGGRMMIFQPECIGKMFDAVEAGRKSDIGNRQTAVLQQYFCVFESYAEKELMRTVPGKNPEYPTEMKRAGITVFSNFHE